jgi:hypothetical protein
VSDVLLAQAPTPFESTTLQIVVIVALLASLATIVFAWRKRRK